MNDDEPSPRPPEGLPDDVAARLRALNGHSLRMAVIYAQELLSADHDPTPQIRPLPGEEIVRVVDHPGYVEVHKRQPCEHGCPECPHGPYVYHVTNERHVDGDERLHWQFVGISTTDEETTDEETTDEETTDEKTTDEKTTDEKTTDEE
ncbi:hypothetical protein [Halomarina ordinaria]|uniref:Uncharacterized protein n=1 Tax=Halomarina ordinaria TaxID=3033939 RepID=A0ABD5UCI7_9EURY|nr:hypothetical protein [Halomarina sp. PSRA2]